LGGGFGGPRYAYDYDRPDPAYGGYYADRYYVDNNRYRERRLGANDRVYVGQDGRYYCRRNDGTTGLIVGGIAVARWARRSPGRVADAGNAAAPLAVRWRAVRSSATMSAAADPKH
jgi:hypothetical protein